jgi:hypothetical protein
MPKQPRPQVVNLAQPGASPGQHPIRPTKRGETMPGIVAAVVIGFLAVLIYVVLF